jgi:hypothetical protein
MPIDASYIRDLAQRCVALARKCPYLPTCQALEALSVELMERASELEKESSLFGTAGDDDNSNQC